MDYYIQEFIDSIESDNSRNVARHVFKRIDVNENIENYNLIQLEHLVLGANINSPKDIITIIYILSSYAKWLKNDNMYEILQSLDKKLLWKKAAPNAKKKFISYEQFERVTKDIATFEEYNA